MSAEPRHSAAGSAAFSAVFAAPLLRRLDARGRADVRAAAVLRELAPRATLFGEGDPADRLLVLASGALRVDGGEPSRVQAGELFGREAFVAGSVRRGRAVAVEQSVLVEIPVGAVRRALVRAGAAEALAREEARTRTRAWIERLRSSALGRELSEAELARLVGAAREVTHARGSVLFERGAPGDVAWFVLSGLVALEPADAAPKSSVYAAPGDVVGLSALLAGSAHEVSARSLGDVISLGMPAAFLRALAERHPGALERAERAASLRLEKQRRLRAVVANAATRHAFDELERLENAGSLLAIDLEACVRCGHCVAACSGAHGTARLERRGEKVTLALREGAGAASVHALVLPNACQHCREPACLPVCPTGAIVKEADGSVQIRDELCTGCGACAKACPWDAVRMAPAAPGAGSHTAAGAAALTAVKCDLCRGLAGPACVSACPTDAIARLDPPRDVVEIGSLVDVARSERSSRRRIPWWAALALVSAVPPLLAGVRLLARVELDEHRLATGALAGCCCALTAAYSALKRQPRLRAHAVRAFERVSGRRSGLAWLVRLHALTGVLAALTVLAHSGLRVPAGTAGLLALSFWLVAASGVAGAVAYRVLPRRLARLERRGALPEDRGAERDALRQRLFDALSERNQAVKVLAQNVVLPYAVSAWGPFVLAACGRSLREEMQALERRIERVLAGHRSERLAEIGELVEIAALLRAQGARRLLESMLGAWLPLHAILCAMLFGLLLLHVIGVVR